MLNSFADEEWPAELRRVVVGTFSDDDIQVLCHDLGIDYEDLRGETKTVRVINLIRRCQQASKQLKLIDLCAQQRPNIDWPKLRLAAETYPAIAQISTSLSTIEVNSQTEKLLDKEALSRPTNILLVVVIGVFLTFAIVLWFVLNNRPKNPSEQNSEIVNNVTLTVPLPTTIIETSTPSVVFSSTKVDVMNVTVVNEITMTVDYVTFESNRVMIHIILDNTARDFIVTSCEFPTLIKSGYGPVPKKDIVERGGFLSNTDGSCLLINDTIIDPRKKQEGWVTYEVDASKFITTGLYTLGSVADRIPITTFEIK